MDKAITHSADCISINVILWEDAFYLIISKGKYSGLTVVVIRVPEEPVVVVYAECVSNHPNQIKAFSQYCKDRKFEQLIIEGNSSNN